MKVLAPTTPRLPPFPAANQTAPKTTSATSPSPTPPATAGAATIVDFSRAAKTQFAKLAGSSTTSASKTAGIKSFDETVQDRSRKLAADLTSRFAKDGIPVDEPMKLEIDSFGRITTDSPYKKKIEKMFEDDPQLAKEFKDIASLNAMKAAQKALEALDTDMKSARDDEEKSMSYELYTARSMASQKLSGVMILDDGKLRSASGEFMAKSMGETTGVKASTKAQQVTGQRISLTT